MVFNVVNHAVLVLVLIVILYPLIFAVSASVSEPQSILSGEVWLLPVGFNLDSYQKVFENEDILMGYVNTILYTVTGTLVSLFVTICAAYPLSRKSFLGRGFFSKFFALTMFLQAGLIPTYLVIKDLNLYNTFWVMILPAAMSVYNMVIMRTFFQTTISQELYDAAAIDGSSNLRTLWSIVLPLSGPGIAVMVLFYGVAKWNDFFTALMYLKDRFRFPLQLIIREILVQNQFDQLMDMSVNSTSQLLAIEGLRYAVIIVSSLPMICLYPFLQKYFVKGVMVGAVKG